MESTSAQSTISEQELYTLIPKKSFNQFYTLGPLLGEGGFGVVYEAVRISDKKRLAAKAIKTYPSRNDVEECLFLKDIKNDYILGSIDYFINTDYTAYIQLVIITELALKDLD